MSELKAFYARKNDRIGTPQPDADQTRNYFFFNSVHCATTRCNFTRELLLETDACRYPTSLYLPIYVFPVYKHCITSSTDDETSESLAKEL